MGQVAEFEEKTFEVAANVELTLLGRGRPCEVCGHYCAYAEDGHPFVGLWSPGQVLEAELGFDVLVDVQGNANALGALLGKAVPGGMPWRSHYPQHPGVDSAPAFASVFIQYKRPERLVRRPQPYWEHFDGPFFRFDIRTGQHQALVRLRQASQGRALVLYAAPRFLTNADLFLLSHQRAVLSRTAFIELDEQEDHRHGAYDEVCAVLLSEPAQVASYGGIGLLAALRLLDLPMAEARDEGFSNHLLDMGRAVTRASRDDVQRASAEDSSPQIVDAVRRVLQFAVANDLTWFVARQRRE